MDKLVTIHGRLSITSSVSTSGWISIASAVNSTIKPNATKDFVIPDSTGSALFNLRIMSSSMSIKALLGSLSANGTVCIAATYSTL